LRFFQLWFICYLYDKFWLLFLIARGRSKVGDSHLEEENFTFQSPDATNIFVRKWNAESSKRKTAVVQIAHGMMEHSKRYERFAYVLAKEGFVVYANDHRGHGGTAQNPDEIGRMNEDGFNWMVEDLHQLNGIIKEQNRGLPVFLFGHSMGSFLVQRFMGMYGDEIQGAILSGTSGKVGPIINVGIWLARLEMRKKGVNWRSKRLHRLVFGGYNRQFTQAKSAFDWLTRDEAEVKAYLEDPLCGLLCSSQFYYEFFSFLKRLHLSENVSAIPRELPVFIFSGDKDPVGRSGNGIRQLVQLYQTAGLVHIDYKLYPGGRHEMLNEINRDEVMQDVIAWMRTIEHE
jgi:alpha-beta hydrolase superfamily lysophospholipase